MTAPYTPPFNPRLRETTVGCRPQYTDLAEWMEFNPEGEDEGYHARIIAALQADGMVWLSGGYELLEWVGSIEGMTPQEIAARDRAWTPSGNLCPHCAGSGRVYAGPYRHPAPFTLSSRDARELDAKFREGPFAACPNGCLQTIHPKSRKPVIGAAEPRKAA